MNNGHVEVTEGRILFPSNVSAMITETPTHAPPSLFPVPPSLSLSMSQR